MTAANRQQRVLILNQYVVPDKAATGLYVFPVAQALAHAGIDVTVLAAEPSYDEEVVTAPFHELRDGVLIRPQPMGPWRGRRSKARRFGGYLRYLAGAARLGAGIVRDTAPDLVVCFTNPPFSGSVTAASISVLASQGFVRVPAAASWR